VGVSVPVGGGGSHNSAADRAQVKKNLAGEARKEGMPKRGSRTTGREDDGRKKKPQGAGGGETGASQIYKRFEQWDSGSLRKINTTHQIPWTRKKRTGRGFTHSECALPGKNKKRTKQDRPWARGGERRKNLHDTSNSEGGPNR